MGRLRIINEGYIQIGPVVASYHNPWGITNLRITPDPANASPVAVVEGEDGHVTVEFAPVGRQRLCRLLRPMIMRENGKIVTSCVSGQMLMARLPEKGYGPQAMCFLQASCEWQQIPVEDGFHLRMSAFPKLYACFVEGFFILGSQEAAAVFVFEG
jgi:hypothetical protein